MSTSAGANEWDVTVPVDGDELLAELRRHGAEPGRRVHMALIGEPPRRRNKVRGLLVGQIAAGDVLSEEDFAAGHRANVDAAERRYGTVEE